MPITVTAEAPRPRRPPRRPRLGCRARHLQRADRPAARGDRVPRRRAGGRRRDRRRPRARPARRGPGDGAQPRAARIARGHADPQHLGADRRLHRRRARAACASARRRSGRRSRRGLSELGLAGLHGSSPDVGIVGYSLGGGIGWLARKHGMQANAVTAIELVTAEGRLVRTDAEHEPDLFWALRGGGGNFGVVTAIEFAVLPGAASSTPARCSSPVEQTADVLHAWTELLPAPARGDHLVGHRHPLPAAAGGARGGPRTLVRDRHGGVPRLRGRRARAAAAAAPARPGDGHVRDAAAGRARRAGDGPARPAALPDSRTPSSTSCPRPRSRSSREIGRAAARRSTMLQLRHMGGALGPPRAGRRRARDAARRDLPCSASGSCPTRTPSRRSPRSSTPCLRRVAPYRAGDYPNFVEEPADASAFFDADTWERLRRVKALYDPQDLFRGNHHIPPADRA